MQTCLAQTRTSKVSIPAKAVDDPGEGDASVGCTQVAHKAQQALRFQVVWGFYYKKSINRTSAHATSAS